MYKLKTVQLLQLYSVVINIHSVTIGHVMRQPRGHLHQRLDGTVQPPYVTCSIHSCELVLSEMKCGKPWLVSGY